jgi:NitT/TauT family transport system substrate-binding protein
MTMTRRALIGSGLAAGAAAALPWSAGFAQDLRRVRLGIGPKSMNATVINLMVGERLGYNRAAGFRLEGMPLGSLSNVLIAIDKGDLEFGVGAPSFQLQLFAKRELPPVVDFYEYTYPYKWDVVVKPDSPLRSYAELRGKKIGVSNLGTTDYPVTRAVLKNIGIDPDKDVSWIAVGEGVTSGIALDRGVVDALAYYDTGFGLIENAGIKLRYLARPSKVPMIGGFFLSARQDFIANNHALCVAMGRSVAMASVFILANPAAAARAFLDIYPGTAPRGASPEEAVAQTVKSIQRRITLYQPPYPNVKMGSIEEAELREEADFLGVHIDDFKPLYSNALIDEINDFDRAKVVEEARNYKI